jgi:hypothetical protein
MWRAMFGGPAKAPAAAAAQENRFTMDNLKNLHASLLREKAAVPSEASDAKLIDIIKQISEMMVYGDKHDESFFQYVSAAVIPWLL